MAYRRIGTFKSLEEFRDYLNGLGIALELDERPSTAAEDSPLAAPMVVHGKRIGNRWAIHPMEGWDGTADGAPSAHTLRRWEHFGESGAKLIWGGEAFAVQQAGRANPNQLYFRPENAAAMRELLQRLRAAHAGRFGASALDDLYVGLQLTHSGRFSRPSRKDRLEPRIVYHHPVLDARVGIAADDDTAVLTDEEIRRLVDDYVRAARMAQQVGFDFVDVKHCHGYLGHEFLSAFDRPGPYGGDFSNRVRFLTEICEGIRSECPGLEIGVRLSLFDMPPFRPDGRTADGKLGPGVPEIAGSGPYPGFGCDRRSPLHLELEEPLELIRYLRDVLQIELVNLSAGSPYYNPHIQRPAYYPPSDGYQPPEDPLIGCARQIEAVRRVKQAFPDMALVGTAYSYFQEFLPHVTQPLVRSGAVDFIGLGRMVLSYWDLPADVLEGRKIAKKRLCRTFSDCTTAPRNGIISGCYPLDPHYKTAPEHAELKHVKQQLRGAAE